MEDPPKRSATLYQSIRRKIAGKQKLYQQNLVDFFKKICCARMQFVRRQDKKCCADFGCVGTVSVPVVRAGVRVCV